MYVECSRSLAKANSSHRQAGIPAFTWLDNLNPESENNHNLELVSIVSIITYESPIVPAFWQTRASVIDRGSGESHSIFSSLSLG